MTIEIKYNYINACICLLYLGSTAERNNAHYEHQKDENPYSEYVMHTWIKKQFKLAEQFALCESKFFSQ